MTQSSPEPDPHAESVRKLANAMLRTGLPAGLAATAVAVVLAAVIVGRTGLYGALVGGGIGLVLALLTIGLMRLSAGLPPVVVMAVAMGGFVFKLIVLLLAVIALKDLPGLHMYSLALTLMTSIFVWAGAEVVAFRRTDIPTIVP